MLCFKTCLFVCLIGFSTLKGVSQIYIVKLVKYEGLRETRERFIDQFCQGDVNEPLDSSKIKKNVQFLKTLPSFANVEYSILFLGNECEITYLFEENITRIPGLAIWQSIDAISIRPSITENNFMGRNMSIGGFYQYNLFHSFYLGFKAPFLFNKSTGIEINAQKIATLEPLYIEKESAIYKYQVSNFELLLIKSFALKHTFKSGVSFFNETYDIHRKETTTNDFANGVNLDKYNIKFDYQFNNIKWHYYLPTGVYNYFGAQNVKTIGFTGNTIAFYNSLSAFKSIKQKNTVATRLITGFTTNVPSPFAPFNIDNNLNLRGVGNIIERASALLVINSEYRRTIFRKKQLVIQSNMFMDVGTWQRFGQTSFFRNDDSNLLMGLGIRVLHKRIFNAIVRVDYGKSILDKSGGFVFGIGQYF